MAFRFSTCNEVFGKQLLEDVCREIRLAGYEGIEIAPFTLATDPASLGANERSTIRSQISKHQLQFVGLHWLLAAPPGLHATAKDPEIRKRTWDYVGHFIDLCADLSTDPSSRPVVVFGSPKQRNSQDGLTSRQATEAFAEGIKKAAPNAERRGVILLIEALSPEQSDVVTSLSEAVSIVKQINSPAIQTMFDTHNAIAESLPHSQLVREFFPYIKHVHVNEMDGKEPGMGNYDFGSLLRTLTDLNYQGWVSLEAFDFTRNPVEIINRSINHLRSC